MKPRWRSLTSTLDQMLREVALPAVGEKKEWVEVEAWPKFVQDFEGDFVVECYVAMFLMLRNHLWPMREAVGTSGMRYREECRRVKQVLLVITPNTMVYFSRGSKAFKYLWPKVTPRICAMQSTLITFLRAQGEGGCGICEDGVAGDGR